jgi:hypothetical protein
MSLVAVEAQLLVMLKAKMIGNEGERALLLSREVQNVCPTKNGARTDHRRGTEVF